MVKQVSQCHCGHVTCLESQVSQAKGVIFPAAAKWREVETTTTKGTCVPIILCRLLTYIDLVVESKLLRKIYMTKFVKPWTRQLKVAAVGCSYF